MITVRRMLRFDDVDEIPRGRNSENIPEDDGDSLIDMDESTVDAVEYFRTHPSAVQNTPESVQNTPGLPYYTYGLSPQFFGRTPEGSPNRRINDSMEVSRGDNESNHSEWSDDEPTRNSSFYGSPIRCSTPNPNFVAISSPSPIRNSDVITISSGSTVDFRNHPNFRAVCSTPVRGMSNNIEAFGLFTFLQCGCYRYTYE